MAAFKGGKNLPRNSFDHTVFNVIGFVVTEDFAVILAIICASVGIVVVVFILAACGLCQRRSRQLQKKNKKPKCKYTSTLHYDPETNAENRCQRDNGFRNRFR